MPKVLLRPQFLIIRNKFRKAKSSRLAFRREMMLLLVSVIIISCIYLAFHLLFHAMREEVSFMAIVPRKLIDLLYAYFLVLLALSSTVAAMGNIYSSETIQLALQAPVSNFRIYTAKYLETAIEIGFMFFVLTAPAGLAYITKLGVHWTFLPVACVLSLVFILIPVGIGVSLATIFAQLIAVLWKRGGILLFGILTAFIGAAVELSQELSRVQENKEGAKAFAGMVGLSSNSAPYWIPSRWISDILGSFLTGSGEGLGIKFLLLIATALATYCLGFFVFDIFSMRVRSAAHVHLAYKSEGKRKHKVDLFRVILERISQLAPVDSHTRAIIVKDLSSSVRDRAQALQLLLYLGLGALHVTIYSFLTNAMAMSSIAQQLWIAFLATSNILLVGFMTTTVLTRLVYPSVSLEGRSFWILQVTPIRVRDLVKAKLFCWLPLTISLSSSLMMVGALAIGLGFLNSALVMLIGVAINLGTTALAIGLGARYASFDWESPSQIAVGLGTLTLLLLSVISVIVFAVPSAILLFLAIVPELRTAIGGGISFLAMTFSLFSILFGSVFMMRTSIESGSRALEAKLGEV